MKNLKPINHRKLTVYCLYIKVKKCDVISYYARTENDKRKMLEFIYDIILCYDRSSLNCITFSLTVFEKTESGLTFLNTVILWKKINGKLKHKTLYSNGRNKNQR